MSYMWYIYKYAHNFTYISVLCFTLPHIHINISIMGVLMYLMNCFATLKSSDNLFVHVF